MEWDGLVGKAGCLYGPISERSIYTQKSPNQGPWSQVQFFNYECWPVPPSSALASKLLNPKSVRIRSLIGQHCLNPTGSWECMLTLACWSTTEYCMNMVLLQIILVFIISILKLLYVIRDVFMKKFIKWISLASFCLGILLNNFEELDFLSAREIWSSSWGFPELKMRTSSPSPLAQNRR